MWCVYHVSCCFCYLFVWLLWTPLTQHTHSLLSAAESVWNLNNVILMPVYSHTHKRRNTWQPWTDISKDGKCTTSRRRKKVFQNRILGGKFINRYLKISLGVILQNDHTGGFLRWLLSGQISFKEELVTFQWQWLIYLKDIKRYNKWKSDHLWATFSSLLWFFKLTENTQMVSLYTRCMPSISWLTNSYSRVFFGGEIFYKIREDHQKHWASKNPCILLIDLTRDFKMGLHNDRVQVEVQDAEAGGMNKSKFLFGC